MIGVPHRTRNFIILAFRGIFGIFALIFLSILLFGAASSSLGNVELTDDQQVDVKQILKQADKLLDKGQYLEAETSLRKAITENPNDSNLKLKLAFTLLKMRIFGEAYDISYEVAKNDMQNAHAYSVLGATLLSGGRFADARRILSRALQLDKEEPLALASLGLLEFYENRLNASLDYLAEARYYEPDEPDYLFAYAQVAARAERYQEAADAYRKFLLFSRIPDDDRRDRIRGLINFLEYLGLRSYLYAVSGTENSVVEFDLKGNRPVIPVRINGSTQPLNFVLDTGSGISVISDQTAKKLKIKPIARGGHAKGIGGDGRFEIVYGFVRDVQIGGAKIKNVPVYIRQFHQNVHNIDGYIGISLISKFLTTVDYGQHTFALNRLNNQQLETAMPQGMTLPLRLTSSGFLSGEVQMEGVNDPMNFIVDTGASVSVVSETVAKRAPFSALPRRDPLTVIGSAGITDNVESFTLPRISFGEHSRERVTAIALNLEIINDASGFEQSGILGGNFFLDYRMTFDFKNSRLIFMPAKQPSASGPPEQDEIKSLP
jgi:tetratricopeptide (TPR) repeat protein/predicted aspartyl protease